MSEGQESRTFLIDREILEQLIDLGTKEPGLFEGTEDLLDWLPTALSRKEINDIGLQVNLGFENRLPEWSHRSGRGAEQRVILGLGFLASTKGDLVSAKNAEKHLWRQGPIGGWLGGVMLRRIINKRIDHEKNRLDDHLDGL